MSFRSDVTAMRWSTLRTLTQAKFSAAAQTILVPPGYSPADDMLLYLTAEDPKFELSGDVLYLNWIALDPTTPLISSVFQRQLFLLPYRNLAKTCFLQALQEMSDEVTVTAGDVLVLNHT